VQLTRSFDLRLKNRAHQEMLRRGHARLVVCFVHGTSKSCCSDVGLLSGEAARLLHPPSDHLCLRDARCAVRCAESDHCVMTTPQRMWTIRESAPIDSAFLPARRLQRGACRGFALAPIDSAFLLARRLQRGACRGFALAELTIVSTCEHARKEHHLPLLAYRTVHIKIYST